MFHLERLGLETFLAKQFYLNACRSTSQNYYFPDLTLGDFTAHTHNLTFYLYS